MANNVSRISIIPVLISSQFIPSSMMAKELTSNDKNEKIIFSIPEKASSTCNLELAHYVSNDTLDYKAAMVVDIENDNVSNMKQIIDEIMETIYHDERSYNLLVEFIKKEESNYTFKSAIVSYFKEDAKESNLINIVDIVLSSDINIFSDWFKNSLLLASKSKYPDLAFHASDVLDYYHRGFQLV
ncbi:MAG: hypothetical protein K5906_04405 [Bacilli bacterium]|nr:hypothetical protein [Bacilli bacterium]